jgi:hypothetical protein
VKATHVRTVRGKLVRALLLMLAVPALMLGSVVSPASADPGTSGDDPCTTGTFSGDSFNGTWTRQYDPYCVGSTTATVTIHWHNTGPDTSGHMHIKWDATITTGAIYTNFCVEVALDWQVPSSMSSHSDAQYLRNCKENSTKDMPSQDITRFAPFSDGWHPWPIWRLQIGLYDPNGSDNVSDVVCPGPNGGAGPSNTSDDAGCTAWLETHGGAAFTSRGAKIYRRPNSGADDQNLPLYPASYDIINQLSASQ